jgi:group II intron reverse transcriptase/maturase
VQVTVEVVVAMHSTDEDGEARPERPNRGKAKPGMNVSARETQSPTQRGKTVSTKLAELAELARRTKGEPVFNLAHHMDVEFLHEAYRRTRKDGARGVDEQSGEEYAVHLEANLEDLYARLKEKRYRTPPVRRVTIPKENGKERPLGIPTFEDKVAQRAVAMLLEPIYEQEFYASSYGFRPGKGAKQALEEVKRQYSTGKVNWLIDADIQGYFDHVDHHLLQAFVAQRVKDGSIKRLIGKWLNAGVWTEGRTEYPEEGTPQGGVISPLLANIYLHYVLDEWFYTTVQPLLEGHAFLVRYADDFVIGFESERDARRVMNALPKRFAKYKLTLHPEKTRLVETKRPPWGAHSGGGGGFTLLGFLHRWRRSWRTGGWYFARRTVSKRFTRALKRLREWMKKHRHDAIASQWATLNIKLRGHYQYYGLLDNRRAVYSFHRHATRMWLYWLNRRGSRGLSWQRFTSTVLSRFPLLLPPPLGAKCHARGTGCVNCARPGL